MLASNFELQLPYRGDAKLIVTLTKESVPEAKRLVDNFKGKLYDCVMRMHRDKRSLTANAYFHALCNKLAAELRYDNDAMKKYLVCKYGTVAELDGLPIQISVPKGGKVDDYYPYSEWISADEHFDFYVLYKQTSAMNSKEFARLIDGTVEDCKEVGIETLPPEELRRLYAQTDTKDRDQQRGQAESL